MQCRAPIRIFMRIFVALLHRYGTNIGFACGKFAVETEVNWFLILINGFKLCQHTDKHS